MLASRSANDSNFVAIPKSSFSCRIGRSGSNFGFTNSMTVADDSHSKWILQPTRTVSILFAVANSREEISEQWKIERVPFRMILHADCVGMRLQSCLLDSSVSRSPRLDFDSIGHF